MMPMRLTGVTVRGFRRGRALNLPTANLDPDARGTRMYPSRSKIPISASTMRTIVRDRTGFEGPSLVQSDPVRSGLLKVR